MNTVLNRSDLHCALCGNSLRALARFCDACGSPINSRHAALERKQVTTLFADVVESMRLAATLESERLREIMHQLLNLSAAVIQRYRGTVDKFTGDGLMAMFGAPVALEDHAVRACIAAVEIQSIVPVLAEEVRRRDNVDLQLRIGLNSGDVIAGEMGSAPNSYTVSGHPVGMAQRMESAAAAGGILCSESTARLAQPSVVFGPMEFVSVKGSHEPIPTRRLERVESDRLVLGRNDGPLVGRDVEMAHLLAVFDAQDMSVVSVVGDPGVGKSRLIRVPGADADTLDALVATELIDQIQLVPVPRYQFRHPLVRSVCYESQLRSTRAASHKRLAMWVQERNDEAVEQNAALIARHFEAAGELAPAYSWYMRSAAWLYHRDVGAARDSWERARRIADRLPVVERRPPGRDRRARLPASRRRVDDLG